MFAVGSDTNHKRLAVSEAKPIALEMSGNA
jgi:hypothetical protein